MFPGMGKVDPRQMKKMMQSMGISQDEIEVEKVIFELKDKVYEINNPQVTAITMQGQKTFQVAGDIVEKDKAPGEKFPTEDVEMVMEQTGKDKETVIAKLEEKNGDIAEAIMELKE